MWASIAMGSFRFRSSQRRCSTLAFTSFERDVKELFDKYDTSGDGLLNFNEFVEGVMQSSQPLYYDFSDDEDEDADSKGPEEWSRAATPTTPTIEAGDTPEKKRVHRVAPLSKEEIDRVSAREVVDAAYAEAVATVHTSPSGKAFPASWGAPPDIQTKDVRRLPGGYGQGSRTLASWIGTTSTATQRERRIVDLTLHPTGRVPQHWGVPSIEAAEGSPPPSGRIRKKTAAR